MDARAHSDDDAEPVPRATLDDLEPTAVRSLLRRVRERQDRVLGRLDDISALRRLNVLAPTIGGELVPTLGGLLALGAYPQQYFPQLNATLVVYPGRSADDVPAGGPRFLDSRAFEGPIPTIVDEAVASIGRIISGSSIVDGVGHDGPDYPVEALREVIVNALLHRDYSRYSRGTPVQLALYADRLTVTNAGGLFGPITEDDLGGEGVSSARNPVLVKVLQDVVIPGTDRAVCDNRASGMSAVIRELRRNDFARPEFHNRINRFTVTLARHPVSRPAVAPPVTEVVPADRDTLILDALTGQRDMSRRDLEMATGLTQITVLRKLESLMAAGRVEATAEARSPHRRYRRTGS